jgi:hypothetical protein
MEHERGAFKINYGTRLMLLPKTARFASFKPGWVARRTERADAAKLDRCANRPKV